MVSVSTKLTANSAGDFQQGVAGMQDIRILRPVRGRGLPREYVGIQHGIGGVERMCTLRATTLPLVAGQKSEAADALMREAAINMALSHPAILPTFGWYERYGELMLVQAFEGLSTMDRVLKSVRKHAAPAADSITWHVALHLFEALAYAHTRAGGPFVHGDVHPACIIIHSSGQILLRGFRGDEPLELQDEKYLTYAAPEVIRGGGTSAASDLYSAALIVREMLTGVPSDPPKRRLHMPMKATAELREGIPSAVTKGLDVCLSVEPSSRALNAAEMASLVRDLAGAGSRCERLQQVRQRVAKALPMAERDLYLGRFVNEQLLDSYGPTVRFERREVLAAEVDTRSSITAIDVFHPSHPLHVQVLGVGQSPPIGYTDEVPDVRIYDDDANEEDEPTLKTIETAVTGRSEKASVADARAPVGEHASSAMPRPSEPTLPDASAVEEFAIETEVRAPSQALESVELSSEAVSSFDVDTEIGMHGREAELVAQQDVVPSARPSVKLNSFPPVAGESHGRPRSSVAVRRVSMIAVGVAAGFAIFGALRLTGWSWGSVDQVRVADATSQPAAQSRLGPAPGVAVRERKKMPAATPRKVTAVKVSKTSKLAHKSTKKSAYKPNASVPGAKLPAPVPWNKSAVIVHGPPDGQVYLNGKKVGHTNRRLLVNGCGYRFLRVGQLLVRPGASSGIRWLASGHTVKLVCGKAVEVRAAVLHTRNKSR